MGTCVEIEENSRVIQQEPVAMAVGTSIAMKNLFFNVPARRNFLKSNPSEMRHIVDEFTRVALAFPSAFFAVGKRPGADASRKRKPETTYRTGVRQLVRQQAGLGTGEYRLPQYLWFWWWQTGDGKNTGAINISSLIAGLSAAPILNRRNHERLYGYGSRAMPSLSYTLAIDLDPSR